MDPKSPSESQIMLSQLMGPDSANNHGNVHGGIIMKLCDEAGAMAAVKHSRSSVVTVTVDSMSFHSPVNLGDLVTFSAEVTWVGRTSIETKVFVTAEKVSKGIVSHTNTAYFVYVAIDEDGKPREVPPLLLETDEEKQRYDRGAQRQAYRLEQRRQGIL